MEIAMSDEMKSVPLMQRPAAELERIHETLLDDKPWVRVARVTRIAGRFQAWGDHGGHVTVDSNGVGEDDKQWVRLRTPDTPTLDEWESAIEGETLVEIRQLSGKTYDGATQSVEMRAADDTIALWCTTAAGAAPRGRQVIRRKPQTTTINFDRESFAALGPDVLVRVLGDHSEQWYRVEAISSTGARIDGEWELAGDEGDEYSTDHGETWHAFTRTVAKGGQS
jgi:hypothetical protein